MEDSVPIIMEPAYWSGAVWAAREGSGWPGPLFGPAPIPLPLVTNRVLAVAMTEVGYQAVGIRPITRRAARSTTATSLLPALATYSSRPSGEMLRASGLLPTGAPGYGARSMVWVTAFEARSITLTWSESPSAT